MARSREAGVVEILAAAQQWRDKCLISEGSVFTRESLWTSSNLDALRAAFLGNLIDDATRSFYDKLQEQLAPASPAAKHLAAEMTWFLLLFPSRIDGNRKRTDICQIWEWADDKLPDNHPLLGSVLDSGVGHAGVAFNTHRWREFAFFIQFMTAFRLLDDARRHRLVNDPWQFAQWIDDETPSKNRAFRHILLYLLFPDSFERIANTRHRRAIVLAFAERTGHSLTVDEVKGLSRLALDRKIFDIRRTLELAHPGIALDFYRPPLAGTFSLAWNASGSSKADEAKPPREIGRNDAQSAALVARLLSNSDETLKQGLQAFADAVQMAEREAPHRWAITLTRHRIHLNVGRLLIASIRRGQLGLSVMEGATSAATDAQARQTISLLRSEPFSSVRGMRLYNIDSARLAEILPLLRPGLGAAIRAAAQTARRPVGIKQHAPGVLDYLEATLGLDLPRPSHQITGGGEVPQAVAVSTPVAGFRATELDLDSLMSDIAIGDIGLPDIQRPFVWTQSKVRDLFDSMYKGYPVGYLLFWETNSGQQAARQIGVSEKAFKAPKRLIVDGQQRLTSLYAVMRGASVLDSEYRPIKIEIAFRPRDGRFEVSDAAIRRDPEFISSVSALFNDEKGAYSLTHDFIGQLSQKRALSDHDREVIGRNLNRLFLLSRYRFSVLEISSELDEESVADIFVRINSEGVKLNQADFILTLLSVIWEDGRKQLESFARAAQRPAEKANRPTPFNHLIAPTPDQLLRVSVIVAFNRARLKSVYHLLRGKDPDTGAVLAERRDQQLEKLQAAQSRVLDLDNWHRFISCITAAGFRLSEQLVSVNALITSYALYLRGLVVPALSAVELDRLVGKWFAMSILTSRYSGAPETIMEQDLGRVIGAASAEAFCEAIDAAIHSSLTNDYWTLTLPLELETSSVRAPSWATFVAAQLRLDAPVLFSDKKLWSILDPLTRGKRRPFEAHHLFPKAWLAGHGVSDRKEINQIANLAFLEWPANMKAGGRSPAEYVPELRAHIGDTQWERMCRLHALPPNWQDMEYQEFLKRRRELMASIIRRGMSSLGSGSSTAVPLDTDGSEEETLVWRNISALERELRAVVRRKYDERWGRAADSQVEKALGSDSVSIANRNRDKYLGQYRFSDPTHGDEFLDFLYLGQLVQLIKWGDAWGLFSAAFRDKRQLEDLIASIIPVRNDAAHFRSVPTTELDRCRLAVNDLRKLISKI